MDLLKLLAQPSLWERKTIGERIYLVLKDGSGHFNPNSQEVILWKNHAGLDVVYEPSELGYILVAPLAIILNNRVK